MNETPLSNRANAKWDRGDDAGALELFRLAAEKGEIDAFNSIGYFYDHGIGVAQDRDKAFFWYKKAARHGAIVSYKNIGLCYKEKGNIKRAKIWLRKALFAHETPKRKLLDGEAAYELAKIYLENRTARSKKHCIYYLKLALTTDNITDDSREKVELLIMAI